MSGSCQVGRPVGLGDGEAEVPDWCDSGTRLSTIALRSRIIASSVRPAVRSPSRGLFSRIRPGDPIPAGTMTPQLSMSLNLISFWRTAAVISRAVPAMAPMIPPTEPSKMHGMMYSLKGARPNKTSPSPAPSALVTIDTPRILATQRHGDTSLARGSNWLLCSTK